MVLYDANADDFISNVNVDFTIGIRRDVVIYLQLSLHFSRDVNNLVRVMLDS